LRVGEEQCFESGFRWMNEGEEFKKNYFNVLKSKMFYFFYWKTGEL
jgi:hypothetical protein